jgi:hypothetical protein
MMSVGKFLRVIVPLVDTGRNDLLQRQCQHSRRQQQEKSGPDGPLFFFCLQFFCLQIFCPATNPQFRSFASVKT